MSVIFDVSMGKDNSAMNMNQITGLRDQRTSCHWGQGPVNRAGTLQVHCKEMDKVPGMYPPGTPQVHSEFSLPVFLQCSQVAHSKSSFTVHLQCPRSSDHSVPI